MKSNFIAMVCKLRRLEDFSPEMVIHKDSAHGEGTVGGRCGRSSQDNGTLQQDLDSTTRNLCSTLKCTESSGRIFDV